MSLWVLDTNTISYFMRGDEAVVPFLLALQPAQVGVPAIVLYELRYGLGRLPREAAVPRLKALEQFLMPLQVLEFDSACAEYAAQIRVQLEKIGQPIGPYDVLIAATSLRYGGRLVTRNVAEFRRVKGLNVVNPHE